MNRKISEISDLEFTLLSSIAQEERKMIVARTKEASKNRIGPIGITLNAKELAYAQSTKKRTGRIMGKISKFGSRIIDAVTQLKTQTLIMWLYGLMGNKAVPYWGTLEPWGRQTMASGVEMVRIKGGLRYGVHLHAIYESGRIKGGLIWYKPIIAFS